MTKDELDQAQRLEESARHFMAALDKEKGLHASDMYRAGKIAGELQTRLEEARTAIRWLIVRRAADADQEPPAGVMDAIKAALEQ